LAQDRRSGSINPARIGRRRNGASLAMGARPYAACAIGSGFDISAISDMWLKNHIFSICQSVYLSSVLAKVNGVYQQL